MITATPLFSGSSGNCTHVKCGETEILVDAGVSCLSVSKALESIGTHACKISGIFVTHEHCDHIKGLETLCKKFSIPVYINDASATHLCFGGASPNLERCLKIKNAGESVNIGNLCVDIFKTPHDACGSVCFRISDNDGDTLGYATDIGYMTKGIASALIGCRNVVLESNHDIEMLKKGPYPYMLKERILSNRGHLSNADCARMMPFLAEKGAQRVWLAHLSEENNTPEIALSESVRALCEAGFEGKTEIVVAKRGII